MNIRKSLAVLSVAAGLLLGSRPADAAVYPDFTVDQDPISNCAALAPTVSCTLVADKMAGTYVEVLTIHSITGPGAGTFSTVAYFNVGSFTTGDDLNTPVPSLLNTEIPPFIDGYDIFAVFGATGSFSTDFGGAGAGDDLVTFTASTGCVELYVDRDVDSGIPPGALPASAPAAPACEGPPPGDGLGITFPAASAADDDLLATATLDFGEGHGFPADPDSGDFSLTFDPFVLTTLGLDVFIAPVPFYMTATIEGLFNAFVPVPGTTLVGGVANAFFAQQVPEPATLALLGMGLLGSAATMRRRRQGKK